MLCRVALVLSRVVWCHVVLCRVVTRVVFWIDLLKSQHVLLKAGKHVTFSIKLL